MREFKILGTPVLATSYAELGQLFQDWSGRPRRVLVEFGNTQVFTMLRHDHEFREVMAEFDYFIPDGMPLIWCLNLAGAKLKDRVYGPTFMREFLSTVPSQYTHYLLGGSEEIGARLKERFQKLNPDIKFVGSFHGRCQADGLLLGESDQEVVDEINRLSPDFIWVSFGAPKQQMWAKRHQHLIRRGVVSMVGFAFDVNAGVKPDAPMWMQRWGMTWIFRLCSEPRRLAGRYARWNFLFLWYLFLDGLRGKAVNRPIPETKRAVASS